MLEPDWQTYGLGESELAELTGVAEAAKAKLILIDSFSSAFPNVDPNKLVQVQGPLWYLRRLAVETNAAVVIIDHLPKPVSGEKAGSRGIIGSIAKSAQARSVHILSRITNSSASTTLLRWDTSKMSYASRPEPFAVELSFDEDKVDIQLKDLPEGHGETRTQQAVRALQNYLEARRGEAVGHQELLDVAMFQANLRKRAAATAIQHVKQNYEQELQITILPGRGKPQAYTLPKLETTASLHQIENKQIQTGESLMHTSTQEIPLTASKEGENEANAAPTQKA